MKVATLEAQVSVIKSEPPVRLAHFSPYPPGWRRMIAVYLYILLEKHARLPWATPSSVRTCRTDLNLTKSFT